MRCYRNIFGISYKDHVTNEMVHSTINHIGPHDDLLTTVKNRKLKRFSHMTRSCGLAKTVPQEQWRSRERGRQRKQCRGMDRETTCRGPSNGTQPQQMEETCAQLVRMAPQQLHRKLREQAKPANVKMVVSNIRCDT